MFYEIQTSHGTSLMHATASGQIEARYPAALTQALRPVLAYVPADHAGCCFLLSADAAPAGLVMHGEPAADQLMPFRLVRLLQEQRVAFAHPHSRLLVSAEPPKDATGLSAIVADRAQVGGWELFDLIEFPSDLASAQARALASAIEGVLSYGLSAPGLAAAVRSPAGGTLLPAIRAIFALLQGEDRSWFARDILSDRPLVARWGNQMADDPWLHDGLPALQDWLGRRRPPSNPRQVVPTTLDLLDGVAYERRYNTFGYHISALARRSVAPSRTLCIVAAVHNQGIYLLEWIAYHRAIGVEQLFIYSSANEDGSDILLGALADAGEIVWLDNQIAPGRRPQAKALAHAFSMLPAVLDYRWSLLIDVDEFLCLDERFDSVPAYLEWQEVQPVDVIAFNRLVFGSTGQSAWQDAPVIERQTHRLASSDTRIRSMARSNQCISATPQQLVFDLRDQPVIRDSAGRLFQSAVAQDNRPAWVNHYPFKSAEEFLWQSADRLAMADGLDIFLDQHHKSDVVEERRIFARSPILRAEMARLAALPGVGEAHSRMSVAFRSRLAQIKEAVRANAAIAGSVAGAEFLKLVPR